jgi:hypothetical protein
MKSMTALSIITDSVYNVLCSVEYLKGRTLRRLDVDGMITFECILGKYVGNV